MVEQLTLAPYLPTQGTARRQDRQTSIDAARAKEPGPDQQHALEALRLAGGGGSIDDVERYFERIGVRRDRGSLSRRLTDLASAGLIVDAGFTELGSRGRQVTVWRLA